MINLKTKIYADGADIKDILALNKKKIIKGFTTNPSLMKKSGVKDYVTFCQKILKTIKKKPVSLEVISKKNKKKKSKNSCYVNFYFFKTKINYQISHVFAFGI